MRQNKLWQILDLDKSVYLAVPSKLDALLGWSESSFNEPGELLVIDTEGQT